MNKSERAAVVSLINYIKKAWRQQSDMLQEDRSLEWKRPGGAAQAFRDSLQALIRLHMLDLEVDMEPLPEGFDISGVRRSRMPRPTPCRNCKKRPLPFRSGDKEYPFKLVHQEPGCPVGTFGLETHQKTQEECVRVWNAHNVKG